MAVEIALQAIAYFTWHRMQQAASGVGKCKVLCIGDSVTYGLGVPEEDSCPRLLGRLAEGNGADWKIVNAGIPGQNSAEVLLRLPHLLRQHQPEHVILLVGWNDQWAKPERLAASALQRELSFPWKLRIGQLLSLAMAQWQLTAPERRGDPAFLGLWNVAGHSLEFFRDGNARLDQIHAQWTLDGQVLRITPSAGGTFDIRWRVAEHGIEFALEGWSEHVLAKPGLPKDDLAARMQDALTRGDLVGARQLLSNATGDSERSPLLAAFVVAIARMGHRDQAGELVAELEGVWVDRRDVECGEALALWHAGGERLQEGLALARTVLGIDSGRIECWRLRTAHASEPQRLELVEELELAARTQENTWRKGQLRLERAVVLALTDPAAAAGEVVRARDLGVGSDATREAMKRAVRLGADAPALMAAASRVDLDPAAKADFLVDMRRAVLDSRAMLDVLAAHVGLMAGACRAAGARLVVLGYPCDWPEHEECMRHHASLLGCRFVSLARHYQAADGSRRDDLFLDEVHLSEEGNRVMAKALFGELGGELR